MVGRRVPAQDGRRGLPRHRQGRDRWRTPPGDRRQLPVHSDLYEFLNFASGTGGYGGLNRPDAAPATTEQSPESNEKAESGIPTLHIILFAGGMVIAIGTLIVMQILKKKRENEAPDDEEDE